MPSKRAGLCSKYNAQVWRAIDSVFAGYFYLTMKIVLATNNPGKIKELQTLLRDSDHEITSQRDYSVGDADENGATLVENALIKARHASRHTGLVAIADDSGLEVDYLGGRPGVHSARYAGENATPQDNIEKLMGALDGVAAQFRGARFRCVIAMVQDAHDPAPAIFHGCWDGRIADAPAGNNGFGYDSVFYIPDLGCTAAELPASVKNKHSHRGKALRQLRQQLI